MRWRGITAAVVGTALCVGFSTKAFTEEPPAGKAPEAKAPEESKSSEQQKILDELANPGPMHGWLGMAAGTWKVTGRCWCEGGKPSDASGTATIRMTLGGRWQEHVFSGSLANRPFVGYGLTGYDNGKKEFTQIWLDNFSTGATLSSGTLSDDKKTLTLTGTMEMGPLNAPFKSTLTVEGENRATYSQTVTVDGQDTPMIELVYERTGAGGGVQAGGGQGGGMQQQGGGAQAEPARGTWRCR
jgi:hypothetical protein